MWSALRVAAPESMLAVYRKLKSTIVTGVDARDEMPGNLTNLLHRETAKQFLATKHAQRKQVKGSLKPSNDQAAHARNFATGMLSFAHEVNGQIALSKGIDPRSPFSDRRMIEFAIRLPLQHKLSKLWYKPILRASMNKILPQCVRLRADVGEHPRWKFFEHFILYVAQSKPEIWVCSHAENALGRWLDAPNLGRALAKYEQNENYIIGYNIFVRLVLVKWLKARLFDLRAGGSVNVDHF